MINTPTPISLIPNDFTPIDFTPIGFTPIGFTPIDNDINNTNNIKKLPKHYLLEKFENLSFN